MTIRAGNGSVSHGSDGSSKVHGSHGSSGDHEVFGMVYDMVLSSRRRTVLWIALFHVVCGTYS